MKILYGVQGTGNGHITRARAMQKEFEKQNIQVDYIFSGREKEKFFDMEPFNDWRHFSGLTFSYQAGEIHYLSTLKKNKIKPLFKDIKQLNVKQYDIILTDFEPITAWAAKRQNIPCIGMGHQMAFDYNIPKEANNFLAKQVMRYFCPSDIKLGLHWHHFEQPILPPIADTHDSEIKNVPNFILVYLGFEDLKQVQHFLKTQKNTQFVIFADIKEQYVNENITINPLSREGFLAALAQCDGVISNAGFELSSEAIQLGKKLLVKPLKGQMEQLSNAKALVELDFGMRMNTLDPTILSEWLKRDNFKSATYPNVAAAIVKWIITGKWKNPTEVQTNIKTLAAELWNNTQGFNNKPTQNSLISAIQNTTSSKV